MCDLNLAGWHRELRRELLRLWKHNLRLRGPNGGRRRARRPRVGRFRLDHRRCRDRRALNRAPCRPSRWRRRSVTGVTRGAHLGRNKPRCRGRFPYHNTRRRTPCRELRRGRNPDGGRARRCVRTTNPHHLRLSSQNTHVRSPGRSWLPFPGWNVRDPLTERAGHSRPVPLLGLSALCKSCGIPPKAKYEYQQSDEKHRESLLVRGCLLHGACSLSCVRVGGCRGWYGTPSYTCCNFEGN